MLSLTPGTPYNIIVSPVSKPTLRDLWFWAILLLAIALRLYRIDAPYVDAHSWRQVTNADVARLWTEIPIDIFFPQVSWGGANGYAGMEFPLLHALTALMWRIVGVSDPAGRLVAVTFSVIGVALMYFLGTRLFNRAAGRGAAFLLACSPTYVYFGRTLLSDVPMTTFSIAAVLMWVKYFDTGRHRDAVWGAIWLALAGLVKIPAILILGPIVWAGWLARRWKLVNDPWVVAGLIGAIGTIGLWYLHADRIFLETGLNQPVFRPSTVYTGDIAAHSGPFTTWEHWTVWDDPENGMRVRTLLARFFYLHLTPLGTLGVLLGFLRLRTARRTIVDIWMLAGFTLATVALRGQFPHEFHQLPLLLPMALYFGLGAQPFFAVEWWGARFRVPALRVAMVTAAIVLAMGGGVWAFRASPAINALYRPNNVNTHLIDSGRAVEAATPPGSLLVVVEYDRYGTNSPMLLYYAHRRGWSFDATAIRSFTIDYLRDRRGACYFATSGWYLIEQIQPETARYVLDTFREVPLSGAAREYRLFDLGCAR